MRGLPLRPLRSHVHRSGYPAVNLSCDGRNSTRLLHHLVAEAFLGPRPEGSLVLHWDDDPTNAALSNLRYGTPSENGKDAVRNGSNRSASQTHCRSGDHPLSGDNLGVNSKGARFCRTCDRARQRRAYRERNVIR